MKILSDFAGVPSATQWLRTRGAILPSGTRIAFVATVAFCLGLTADASAQNSSPRITPPISAAPADDGQWTMPAKNYASTRFSELDEINEENVKDLRVAFTFSTGVNKGHEAAPLVVENTMYIVTPYPNILTHRCHILETGNDSFRFKASSAAAAQKRGEKTNPLTKA